MLSVRRYGSARVTRVSARLLCEQDNDDKVKRKHDRQCTALCTVFVNIKVIQL